MARNKSITELVTELQQENESLQSLKKLFNQAVKNEFGYDVKALHTIIEKYHQLEKKNDRVTTAEQGQQSNFSRSEN